MKKFKPLFIILALVAVGIAAYFFNKSYLKSSGVTTTTVTKTTAPVKTEIPKTTTERIVYGATKDGSKEILTIDFAGKDQKTLYTDKDEDLKIKTFGGLAYLSREILVVDSNNLGNLVVIKADGSGGKEVVVKNFGAPKSLGISPNGEKISYVTFSNTEADYGFGLYQIGRHGENPRQLAKSDQEIKNLSWNPDSNKISYTETSGKSVLVKVVDTDSGKAETILTSDKSILGLSWNQGNKIVFSTGSEVKSINPDGSKAETIAVVKDNVAISPYCTSDLNFLAYLQTEVKDQINVADGGKLVDYVLGQNKNNIESNISVSQILGWLQ